MKMYQFNVTSLNANSDLDVRTAPDWEPFFVTKPYF